MFNILIAHCIGKSTRIEIFIMETLYADILDLELCTINNVKLGQVAANQMVGSHEVSFSSPFQIKINGSSLHIAYVQSNLNCIRIDLFLTMTAM